MVWEGCYTLTVKPWEGPHIRLAVWALLESVSVRATGGSVSCPFSRSLSLRPQYPVYLRVTDWATECERSCFSHGRREGVCVFERERATDTLPFPLSLPPPAPLCPMTPPWRVFVCLRVRVIVLPWGTRLSPRGALTVTQLCPDQTYISSFPDSQPLHLQVRWMHTCAVFGS